MEKLDSLKKEEKDRLRQMGNLESEIVRLQADVNREPPHDLADEEELKQRTRELNLDRAALESRTEEFNSKLRECSDKKGAARARLEAAEQECVFF